MLAVVSDSPEATAAVRDHVKYFVRGQLACRGSGGFKMSQPELFAQGEDGRYLYASSIELDLSVSERSDPVSQLGELGDFLTNGSAPRKGNSAGPVGSQLIPGTPRSDFMCLAASANHLHSA